MSFALKSPMPQIAENDALRRRLCDDILSGKLAHAYIIEGAVGSGRHTLALNIAKAAACENRSVDSLPLPCDNCEACRKISEGICPDVIIVSREADKSGLGVDAARFIRGDVSSVPNDLDIKVYIIEDADLMTVQAQNALLLTLEEPPLFAIFLLLCEQADRLLETVRSRAPTIRTEPVSRETVAECLLTRATDEISSTAKQLKRTSPEEFEELITASSGCVGRAYELFDPRARAATLEFRAQVRELVTDLLSSGSQSSMLELLMSLPQKRDELAGLLDTVSLALRDLIVLKKSESAELCFYSDRENALELSGQRSAASLLRLVEVCEEAADALRRNANIKLTLTRFAAGNR